MSILSVVSTQPVCPAVVFQLHVKKSRKILEYMGSTELAANLFRATQAEDKLRRDKVDNKRQANQTHFAEVFAR